MKLYFLRHGIAADAQTFAGSDFDRPLTDEGVQKLTREAKAMERLDLEVERIITSPLVRAKQTAEIVAERLRMRVLEDARLDPSFSLERLSQIVRDHADAQGIMIVGHEPSFSETLGRLIGGANIDLKKGALAYVELPDASSLEGTLVWLASPKVLLA